MKIKIKVIKIWGHNYSSAIRKFMIQKKKKKNVKKEGDEKSLSQTQ